MKNLLIIIMLGLAFSSCSKSKYANLDSQFTKKENKHLYTKYNNKNLIQENKRKRDVVRQLAIVTREQ